MIGNSAPEKPVLVRVSKRCRRAVERMRNFFGYCARFVFLNDKIQNVTHLHLLGIFSELFWCFMSFCVKTFSKEILAFQNKSLLESLDY